MAKQIDFTTAFPSEALSEVGMFLRDYFAIRAPEISEDYVKREMESDRLRNPHNDTYKPARRSAVEIRCQARYKWADEMMKARTVRFEE